MQEERYDELRERSIGEMKRLFKVDQQAQQAILGELAAMVAEDKVLELSEEEERLLRSFRRFKLGCTPGAVFKWQTRPADGGITVVQDSGLIRDPQEVG